MTAPHRNEPRFTVHCSTTELPPVGGTTGGGQSLVISEVSVLLTHQPGGFEKSRGTAMHGTVQDKNKGGLSALEIPTLSPIVVLIEPNDA